MMRRIIAGAGAFGLLVAAGNYLYHTLPREPEYLHYQGCDALRSTNGQIYLHADPVNVMRYIRQLDTSTLEDALDYTEVRP